MVKAARMAETRQGIRPETPGYFHTPVGGFIRPSTTTPEPGRGGSNDIPRRFGQADVLPDNPPAPVQSPVQCGRAVCEHPRYT